MTMIQMRMPAVNLDMPTVKINMAMITIIMAGIKFIRYAREVPKAMLRKVRKGVKNVARGGNGAEAEGATSGTLCRCLLRSGYRRADNSGPWTRAVVAVVPHAEEGVSRREVLQ